MPEKNAHENAQNNEMEQSVSKPNNVVSATLDDLIDIVSQSAPEAVAAGPVPKEDSVEPAPAPTKETPVKNEQVKAEQEFPPQKKPLTEIEKLNHLIIELSAKNETLIKEEKKLKEALEKSSVYLDQLTILKRDFENYRARTQNATERAKDDGKLFVIEKMLPLLENFSKAEDSFKENKEMSKPLAILRKQFESILADVGVKEIAILGQPFDPALAEALDKKVVEDESLKGIVLEVYSKGYTYNQKVAIYAKVKVGV